MAKKAKAAAAASDGLTIQDAAKAAGTSVVSLRSRFRKYGVKKSGKSYSWSNKTAMLKDIKKAEAA